jgi:hypothetical protein
MDSIQLKYDDCNIIPQKKFILWQIFGTKKVFRAEFISKDEAENRKHELMKLFCYQHHEFTIMEI